MRIGFIGAGKNAQTMARHFLAAGHNIVLSNSRGPETLAATIHELGAGAVAGTRQEASQADLVILAVNWVDVGKALSKLDFMGRILVDATNAHSALPPDLTAEGIARSLVALNGRGSSEIVAERVPTARVVKAISNMPMSWIGDFRPSKPKAVLFVAGDDEPAKKVVRDLLQGAGFAAVDLGSLADGDRLFDVGRPLSGLELHLVRRAR